MSEEAPSALFTDLYELTMASAYHQEQVDDRATFELWVRSLPADRNFLVAAGLEQALDFLEGLHISGSDLNYLESLDMFPGPFLERLRSLTFTGDVWAMPEGMVFFAGEPILRVTAPRIEAQIVETFLLNALTFQSMIASKAARIAIAARGRPFADFSARRDHGPGAAMLVARASYLGGAASTSNVAAGRDYGIPVSGTMAHSFVLSFPSELEAFRAYARSFPHGGTLLIDTFDTVEGARNAIAVGRELEISGGSLGAVRLDSGDLGALAKRVREVLDEAGFPAVRIVASSDLDEFVIAALLRDEAPIDAFGVGTRLGTSADAPSLGGVYKLVEDERGGRAKSSTGKSTLPYAKQVYRVSRDGIAERDTISRAGEEGIDGTALLHQVMDGGRRTGPQESLETLRERCREQLGQLPGNLRELRTVDAGYPVNLSPALRAEDQS